MKSISFVVFIICFTLDILFAGENTELAKASEYIREKGEVYLSIDRNRRLSLNELNMMVSIDRVEGNKIYAYANRVGFNKFLDLNVSYQVLTHPGDLLVNPKMSDYEDPMTREWDSYPTYQGYLNILNQFETDYPNLCKVVDLGPAGEASMNHRMYVVKISDNVDSDEAEPEFFYSATMHGNECLVYVTMLHFMDTLLSSYSTDPQIKYLVDNIEIWIAPLCNPDGTYKGGDHTVSGAIRFNVADTFDINRNFPCACEQGDHKYYGLYSYYTKEAEALVNFQNQHTITLSADLHNGTEAILWPFGGIRSRSKDEDWFKYVAQEYVDTVHAACHNNGYMTSCGGDGLGHIYTELYETHGTPVDFRTMYRQCKSLYCELSLIKAVPATDLLKYWRYNYRSLFNYLRQVFYGINGFVTDSITGAPLKANVYIEGHDDYRSLTYSDSVHGNYYRPIIAGTYDVTFSCDDYIPKTIHNITVINNQATPLNAELVPNSTISLSRPNGSEIYYVGENHNITWSTFNVIGNIKIEYSVNNGSTWSTITDNTENDGSYPWTIPDSPSTTCLVRLFEVDDNFPCDTCDNIFTISAPIIELSSPNGGEKFYEGDQHTITWVNKGPVGNVDIEYSIDNGQNWLTVISNTGNSGSSIWTIPDNPSTTCLIRVSETVDDDPIDISDSVFTISSPVIALSEPNGGELFYAGDTTHITWSCLGFVGNVKIEYSIDSGSTWLTVIADTVNSGSYTWTIPDNPSSLCKTRVCEASDNLPIDASDSIFTISSPTILVSTPNGGERWYIGQSNPITWSTNGVVGNVRIEFTTDNGTNWKVITDNTANSGTYLWTVPDDSSSQCKARISEASDNNPIDVSDNSFSIEIVPEITVSYPAGGEVLFIDSTYTLVWTSTWNVNDVKIEYSTNNGTSWLLVTPGTANDGKYDWIIPDGPSTECKLQISEQDGFPIAVNNGTFSLQHAPSISVTFPNGGEKLEIGTMYMIRWTTQGMVGDVKIEYTSDSASIWNIIVSRIANTGSFNWTIPNTPSAQCKIRITDVTNGSPVDVSDSLFSIDLTSVIQNDMSDKFNGSFSIVPNPADKNTSNLISFYVTSPKRISRATLRVYDAVGNKLFTIDSNSQIPSNKQHQLGNWSLGNNNGTKVSCGNYLTVLKVIDNEGNVSVIKRLIGISN